MLLLGIELAAEQQADALIALLMLSNNATLFFKALKQYWILKALGMICRSLSSLRRRIARDG